MGGSRRQRAGSTPITEAHFRLLREFGRHPVQKKTSRERDREKLWQLACDTGQVPYIPRERVIEAWKEYVGGLSKVSGIAINGDVDPNYTTLGITYQNKITAAHTTKTLSLLRRVLFIFAKTFKGRTEFLNAAEALCRKTADKIWAEK